MNSIITSNGSKARGVPEGTKSEKNFNPCVVNPNIVDPNTTEKLRDKATTS
jgi:hypothetical protein